MQGWILLDCWLLEKSECIFWSIISKSMSLSPSCYFLFFSYFPFSFQQCSHPCGRKGRQIRRLYCHNAAGKKVARIHCPPEYKPQRKRKCNQRKCGPVTCLEIQKRLKITTDGEYLLLIGGRNMTIYCHGMSSAEPREYLTLPAGDSENYAEIYDKRLTQIIILFSVFRALFFSTIQWFFVL